jgi:hypothetical protein
VDGAPVAALAAFMIYGAIVHLWLEPDIPPDDIGPWRLLALALLLPLLYYGHALSDSVEFDGVRIIYRRWPN